MNNLRNEKLLIRFGDHLRALRLARDLTQEDLAYACEMELSQIYRIEKGKVNATISTLEALSKGLEISIGELLKDF
jgi:transcriptional regulator with XRE-family HTH domain